MAKSKKAPRAGFIPYYYVNGELHIMLMKPSNAKFGGDEFQVAKGKIEDGETAEVAAIREASEELGLREQNLLDINYLGKFLGYTEIFYGQVKDQSDFGETTYETEVTLWLPPEKFFDIGRRIHFPIVREFLNKFR